MYAGGANFGSGSHEWRTPVYNAIVQHKWSLILQTISAGYNAFIMGERFTPTRHNTHPLTHTHTHTQDVDIVLLRNPFNYIADLPTCDVIASTDAHPPGIKEDSEFRWSEHNNHTSVWFNTGLMLWRATDASLAVVEGFLEYVAEHESDALDDQTHFYAFLQARAAENSASSLNMPFIKLALGCANWAGISYQVLPPALFGTQRHMYEFKLAQEAAVIPYTIHFNWLSGFAAKQQRMAEVGLWS